MKLTVKPLKQKDAGRGLAAIDRAAMREMELENGDYILIEGSGSGRAVARVWPGYPEDEGRGVIRIDGRLRQEASVGIDDNVDVEKADVKPAKSVTVALPQNLRVRGNIGTYIRDKLSGQAVTQGQTVPFSLGFGPLSSMSGQQIPVRIADTDPDGTVVVTDSTNLEVSEKPAEQIKEILNNYPEVDYLQVQNPDYLPALKLLQKPIILKIPAPMLENGALLKETLHKSKEDVAYFLFEGNDDTDQALINEALNLANQYSLLLGFGLEKNNVVALLEKSQLKGIALRGGDEIKPGYKDFDDLADILEAIEVDDLE